jgi:hypothetical protein
MFRLILFFDEMNVYLNRDHLRLKEETEKLQKKLAYEQSKQFAKSPNPGKIN